VRSVGGAILGQRRTLGLTQAELAAMLEVSLNSFRMWDSGLRSVPAMVLDRTKAHVTHHAHEAESLPLKRLTCPSPSQNRNM